MSAAPLRILQVNSLFTGGGADNQTLELSAGLRELGEDVTLGVPIGSRWESRARQLGVRVATFPARSPLKSALIRGCIQLIREHRIQVIHAHQGRDYWPSILAARLAGRGTRVVVTRHLMTRPRRLTRMLLLRAAHVVAVSRAVEAVVRENLRGPSSKVQQIYCGVDFSRFLPARTPEVWQLRERLGWAADAVAFAVVGSFHLPHGKGQMEFLEAAARIKKEFTQARFVIAGYGEMESMLKERIVALGLAGVASVLPFNEEIPLLMSALDVLVLPTTASEAFGLVTVEALGSGRPVIASRKDGIAECFIDGEHGRLLPPGDVTALAGAMRELLVDPALRQRYGEAGRAYVRAHFDRSLMARRTRDLYAEICGG
jgi:glycosyltransferase involved in cell wall biosynthesis